MTEMRDWHEPLEEIEALIRSARDYVRPCDDLRPRVLEAVREQREQRRTSGYCSLAAALLIVVSLIGSGLYRRWQQAPANLMATNSLAGSAAARDPAWRMVDTLTELRRRQAELLHTASLQPRPKA